MPDWSDANLVPHWDRSALLTVDLQRDFLSDARYGVAGTSEVLPAVRALVASYRRAGRLIVHIVRLYRPDGSNADLARRTLLASGVRLVHPGTAGSQLAAGLAPADAAELDPSALLGGMRQRLGEREFVVYKPRWNAFYDTALGATLREFGVDTVVVAGANYPNCPRATLYGASERDYRAVAVGDAISGWTPVAAGELAGLGIATIAAAELTAAVAGAAESGPPPAEIDAEGGSIGI